MPAEAIYIPAALTDWPKGCFPSGAVLIVQTRSAAATAERLGYVWYYGQP